MKKTIFELHEELTQMINEGFGFHELLNGFNIWDFMYDEYSTPEQTKNCVKQAAEKIIKSLKEEK